MTIDEKSIKSQIDFAILPIKVTVLCYFEDAETKTPKQFERVVFSCTEKGNINYSIFLLQWALCLVSE